MLCGSKMEIGRDRDTKMSKADQALTCYRYSFELWSAVRSGGVGSWLQCSELQ